ncbi:hypothetical protein [Pseudoxanthomonas jiangsuensis]|uniref:hypothetical protein n=1 Tax=Pseudoxanthomonas jiangsuensis TaxID=619688 RepID=UPI0013911D49|nr:hypothetical protein [Pseudoxanthomonas jiangsuensis]
MFIDNAAIPPVPRLHYADVCVAEENPWRKVFHAGTAGTPTENFCAQRLINGATYQLVRLASQTHVIVALPQSDIETLITLMKPSMSQLAAAFGVSRQRIYDWRNGEGMSVANTEQMAALLVAARMLSERSSAIGKLANRRLVGGNTFWDVIATGVSPVEAANAALRTIERDEDERAALKRSLASRNVAPNKDTPLFSAHLSE